MRWILPFVVMVLAQPAFAGSPQRNFYGPLQSLWGVGYKDRAESDGMLRIEYRSRPLDNFYFSADAAMYRAAELAQQQGKRYVELHDLFVRTDRFNSSTAILFAKPSDDPAQPLACRSKKEGRCYTAHVARLIEALNGPTGREPGVVKRVGTDQHSRLVFSSGFGLAATNGR